MENDETLDVHNSTIEIHYFLEQKKNLHDFAELCCENRSGPCA